MGIPKFYRWLSERFPLINEKISDTQYLPPVDGLYLDLNSVIHNATHKKDGLVTQKKAEDVAQDLFNYIDHIVLTIKPRRTLFLAVDGVAPRAKLNQQRSRRFKAGQSKEEEEYRLASSGIHLSGTVFDTNCITPGTEFMDEVDQYFLYLLHAKLSSDPLWTSINVIYSSHSVPGEGEHKIMAYLRDQYSRDDYDSMQRHCIYGLDADLILLSLSLHDKNVILLREVIDFTFKGKPKKTEEIDNKPPEVKDKIYDSTWDILHINLLREYLFLELKPDVSLPWLNNEKMIDDFICMMIFSGNDFMPQIPALDINDNCIETFFDIYRSLLPEMKGHLVEDARPNPDRLKLIFDAIGKNEYDVYTTLKTKDTNMKRKNHTETLYYDDVTYLEKSLEAIPGGLPIPRSEEQITSTLRKIMNVTFKDRYYLEKFNLLPTDVSVKEDLCLNYYQGLCWVMQYYYRDIPSWTWFYSYHYSPFASDISKLLTKNPKISFTKGQPFLPFQQQMGCLPPQSVDLLPPIYRPLMTNPNSPIIAYYPTHFDIDMNGKTNDWEGLAIIPFINEYKLKEALKEVEEKTPLTEKEKNRNSFGYAYSYTYNTVLDYTYKSPFNVNIFPDISHCHCKIEEFIILSPTKNQEDSYLTNNRLLDNTPSLYNLKFSYKRENVKITVMNRVSKNHTILLSIVPHFPVNVKLPQSSFNVFAKKILNKMCWYGYPHLRPALIVGTYTADSSFMYTEEDSKPSISIKKITYHEVETNKFCIDWYNTNLYKGKSGALGFGGIELPPVQLLLVLRPLSTYKHENDCSSLAEKYSKQTILYPFDLVLFKNDRIPEELKTNNIFKDINHYLIPGTTCIYTGPGSFKNNSLYGCQATIDTVLNKQNVKVNCILDAPEPMFAHTYVENYYKNQEQYYSSQELADKLHVPKEVVETLSGNYLIDSQFNIGLKLHTTSNTTLLGYCKGMLVDSMSTWNYEDRYDDIPAIYALAFKMTRPKNFKKNNDSDNTVYVYSNKALNLYMEFFKRFPDLLKGMIKTGCTINGTVLLGDKYRNYVDSICDYLKYSKVYTGRYVPCNSEVLDSQTIQDIQAAGSEYYHNRQQSLNNGSLKTMRVSMIVNPKQLVTPIVDPYKVYPQEIVPNSPSLGQRVLNIRLGDCAYGERGTVIGIYSLRREVVVLYDQPYIGNDDFGGLCNICRATTIPWLYCISLNNEVAFGDKPKQITEL